MFFSSRGHFNRPAGTHRLDRRAPVVGRLAELRQLPLQGLDRRRGLVVRLRPAQVGALAGSFNPRNRDQQKILNYSAHLRRGRRTSRLNIRNVSGPGALAAPLPCSAPPPDHEHLRPQPRPAHRRQRQHQPARPASSTTSLKPNAGRSQVTVTLPGSTAQVQALDALKHWVQFAVRVPNGPLDQRRDRGRRAGRPRSSRAAPCSRPAVHELPRRRAVERRASRTSPRRRRQRDRLRGRPGAAAPPGSPAPRRRSSATRSAAQYLDRFLRGRRLVQPRRRRARATRSATTSARVEKADAGARRRRRRSRRRTRSASTTTTTAAATASTCSRCSASTPCRPTCTTAPARPSPASSAT